MKGVVRSRLEMAGRVRAFLRAHPFSDPTAAALVARFEERVSRAEALAVQQSAGDSASRAATARRQALRRTLRGSLLRHLSQVGRLAAVTAPDLAGAFRVPRRLDSRQALLAVARGMAEAAVRHREALAEHGLTEALLGELLEAVEQFETAANVGAQARRDRIGAVAEVLAVTTHLRALVRVLDGLNRHRFRENGELLAAWASAQGVAGSGSRSSRRTGDGDLTSAG